MNINRNEPTKERFTCSESENKYPATFRREYLFNTFFTSIIFLSVKQKLYFNFSTFFSKNYEIETFKNKRCNNFCFKNFLKVELLILKY